ncbi:MULTISPECIES: sugar phosphate isomerase/epimerase family protein [unclassified Pseudoclavibacter]|uniref:sugar phosphate isomerase/epimerase family protein n=1 Tax=unclassified Pseudoclavibacter TaxID=2615177 RepID=UPI000CE7CC1D|nr:MULTISPECIES: sugar phosphate isomerase/epimerase [unclassified Pseudoclavibacter]MBS3179980.1 sugar phosphate isomerase/epimerase [Pseudoclavibacter sp. Marseille-Q4354]NYF12614.1 sugar phosphate isomerase/epimerase [Pseudoclavibacter sp. JAI123]PPG33419.1 sugar phosphate isomerase/epimerase [Pseudoclavibacter sp. RFBB5]
MIQVGIFSGYFPYDLKTTAQKARELGFNTVQLDLHFKDLDLTAGQITKEKAKLVADTFRDNNLPISAISGYTNIVHPDPEHRRANVDYLKEIIRNARSFGTPYVISESGTFNPDSEWDSDPHNKTEDAYEQVRDVLAELAQEAYDHGSIFLLETYVNNVIGSVRETVRVFNDIRSPGIELLMDPTNYFDASNIDDQAGVLNEVFDTLADKVRVAHAKDVKRAGDDKSEKHADIGDDDALASHTFRGVGEIELPAAGLGSLDYELYLQRLAERNPNAPLIIEHLDESDIPRAKKFIDDILRKYSI